MQRAHHGGAGGRVAGGLRDLHVHVKGVLGGGARQTEKQKKKKKKKGKIERRRRRRRRRRHPLTDAEKQN
jgi:hypothetical protein